MAEGILREMAGDTFAVSSAGLKSGNVHPKAIQVMEEIGIDISFHTSDDINLYIDQEFDYIITVCDNANESCPNFPGFGKRIHWSFHDPAEATGTEEEILSVFRKVRDQIKSEIVDFVRTTTTT